MPTPERWLLRYTNAHREVFYFVRFGEQHGAIRLIAETSPDITKATEFDTMPDAVAALQEAGGPSNWDAILRP